MFDPTAFDNMKVIIEGALYDHDMAGDINIIDRNDWVNIAKMSRQFNISFTFPQDSKRTTSATIELQSGVSNLAAELTPEFVTSKLSGAFVKLFFTLHHPNETNYYQVIETIILDIWGHSRTITQQVEWNPLNSQETIKNVVTIDFNRMITEEQMEDLLEMTRYMIITLEKLYEFLRVK
ncbi:hypothetical protein [Neobacillus thermocopriae]|uniref:Group-specific protein n=1 Tax=Neobacillus thermocopriae TaxID=1215031 RepID=A0A6B3TTI1_9BACI|nr:hypothetical protein [Neobacillus thermocopriae]MED3625066.1 hypothetical protein [Neobacillus thermocopriae]MED3712736.1 hypothetical protein [Neobacillus thermocopriae]NEX78977.1 hypothetical protein [Neobacillus thermocopriae]